MAKNLKVGMLVCASILAANAAYANYPSSNELLTVTQQTGKIKGTIVDSKTGEPVIGASVKVKGTKLAAVTDLNGEFELNTHANATLQISYVGFKETEVKASNGMKISLEEDTESLEEVVVVGYGTQKKESLTGAMANIKGEKLKDITSATVENMLNGKVSGVYVAPGSGRPGSTGAIIIRGQTSINGATAPLWVVDGVIVGNSAGDLNPDDIETMTVLKDAASTAIYGSEGANGVVVVTTKQAKHEKMSISLSAKAGLSTLNRGNLEMMDGAEFYDYYKSFQNVESVNFPRWNEDLRNSNFDWFKLAKKTGSTQDYNLTLNGGSQNIQSMFTLGYFKEEGAVKGYDMNRYSTRIKVVYKPYEWLTIKPNISGSRTNDKDKQYSVGAMYSMMPWDSPYDENGNLVPNYYAGWVNSKATNYLNDLAAGDYSTSTTYDLSGGLDFDIQIAPWLTFSSVNNYSYYNSQTHGYYDPKSSSGEGVNGRTTEYNYTSTRRYTNQLLRFKKSWGKHNVNALLAYEFNDYEMKYTDVYATGFISGFEDFMTAAKPEMANGYRTAWAKQSYFTQWRYDYDSRYYGELSLRRDGRSNFGSNNRYGNFFSVSGAWNINNESWFKADWVDQLKLRAAFGSVGNVPTSLYPSYSLYSVGATYNENPGALISQIGNKDLTWEKTYTTGVGVDASFWQNRLHATLDYYIKNTSNILYQVPVTGLVGVTSIWKNIGKMRNTGIELTVGGDIIRTKDLTWNVTANISHNSNELRDLYKQRDANGNYVVKPVLISDGTSIAGTAQRILEIGEPVDTYYMKEWAGVNPEDGKPQWYMDDANGNKVVTDSYSKASYYKCGKASPDVYGSFSTSLFYKNFDLQANFGYSLGGQIYSYYRQEFDSDGAYAGDRNQMKLQKGWSRWEKPGDIATHPRAMYNNQDKGNLASSRYLESSDYLKLRSLTLGYNFDLKKYGIQTLRLSVSGENLFTITDYSGVDPELPAGTNDKGVLSVTSTGGTSVYPAVRKFMLGVNLTF
ncbi:TonB-dependent receptor [Prevotella copri]|uniref:SusC/RagA family TonB-linked outer membrane protein n=1 Tax=Segatella copri TaxID=165179 RepID=UPI00222EA849|nr:TonB-dependent receptor [Segatella copri]MCW4118041.1 TonB-dependent receptor [Segatella copri]